MVIEQEFWYNLKAEPEYRHDGECVGEFREMLKVQHRAEGFLTTFLMKGHGHNEMTNMSDRIDGDNELLR